MKTTEELFLELLMVSIGQMDCLSRAPEPEEWGRLYELSKTHKVEGIAYQGVVKLFEYGLRAPQDVSIEWMSEAEIIKETNEASMDSLRARSYPVALKSLRQNDDDDLQAVKFLTLQQLYRLYRRNRLTVRALMDYYFTLVNTSGRHEPLKGRGLAFALLGSVGIRRFARGTMWLLQQSFNLDRSVMPCEPFAQEGHYLFTALTQGVGFRQRLVHRLLSGY